MRAADDFAATMTAWMEIALARLRLSAVRLRLWAVRLRRWLVRAGRRSEPALRRFGQWSRHGASATAHIIGSSPTWLGPLIESNRAFTSSMLVLLLAAVALVAAAGGWGGPAAAGMPPPQPGFSGQTPAP